MKDYFGNINLSYNEEEEDFLHEFKKVSKHLFNAFFSYAKDSETISVDDFARFVIAAVDELLVDKKINPYAIGYRKPYSFGENLFMDFLMLRIREENPEIIDEIQNNNGAKFYFGDEEE